MVFFRLFLRLGAIFIVKTAFENVLFFLVNSFKKNVIVQEILMLYPCKIHWCLRTPQESTPEYILDCNIKMGVLCSRVIVKPYSKISIILYDTGSFQSSGNFTKFENEYLENG